jgi:predicted transposase YbfD/YdcC
MQLFLTAFESVPDPRAENVRHSLIEVLLIAFVAVLCGAQSCTEMAEFGRAKIKLFKTFLKLKHSIPSHDTFSTVFRMLDPKALDAAFGRLTATLVAALGKGGVIAIDGKSLKGAYEKGEKSSAQLMVSAFAAGLRLTLATVAAKDRNEVDAALEVLGLIDLKGKIVTADALHCNRGMVSTIVEKGGDYCITLKGNQESLLSDARACLGKADNAKKKPPTAKTEDSGHGRTETRVAVVVEAKGLADYHEFVGLKAFGRIESSRTIDGRTETDVRIYALSRRLTPQQLLTTARAHWEIENALHWQLDVSFREDAARNRKDNGPANIAVMRRRALDVARLDKSKGSLTAKLKRAGWDDDFMLKLLSQMR